MINYLLSTIIGLLFCLVVMLGMIHSVLIDIRIAVKEQVRRPPVRASGIRRTGWKIVK